MIQSLCRFKFFGLKVLVSIQLWKFRGLKRYNRFADSNFLYKSTCITSSLKTSGIWSDTIALPILSPLKEYQYRFSRYFFSESRPPLTVSQCRSDVPSTFRGDSLSVWEGCANYFLFGTISQCEIGVLYSIGWDILSTVTESLIFQCFIPQCPPPPFTHTFHTKTQEHDPFDQKLHYTQ
jgi:hypothetical protein